VRSVQRRIHWRLSRLRQNKKIVAGQEFFESNPNVRGGELFAAETRISVTVILDSLAEGSTQEEILRSYPSQKRGHTATALADAGELAHEQRLVPRRLSQREFSYLRISRSVFYPDWGADEAEGFTDLVFQKALVGEM
jgi:uncharacterized protein (DUF433 family)